MKFCPATDYATQVLEGKIATCKYVRLACKRFIEDLTRDDIWYDWEAAERFFTYCTFLKHYKGPLKGQPIELELWQKFYFGNVYGWKRCEEKKGKWIHTDIWRFHYNYLEVPRKNGKTTIAAAGASYDAAYMEDMGAEVYCLATKEDQAKILWGDVKAFIHQSEELKQVFEVLEGRNTIYARESGRTSFVKPLGANSERLDGLNPFSAYCDELHEWPDRKLLDVIEDAFGARVNWHINQITTAGYNKQGICFQERKHLIDILEGRIVNDDKFGMIYTVDEEDRDRWMEEDVWYKSNPNLGTGKQIEYMRSKAQKADQIPTELNTFLNKQLDIWTDVLQAWLKWDTWKKCHRVFDGESMRGKKCFAAGDLGKVSDLSAVAYLFPPQKGLDDFHVLLDFYCPEANVRTRHERDKLPYQVWVKEGWIRETQGETTDFKFIEADIIARAEMFDLTEITFDRTFAGEIVNNLMEELGAERVTTFGQGFMSMGAPTSELERLLIKQAIFTEGNPVLDWMSSNVVVRTDPAGNLKPDKEASEEKIDGIVAVIMALGRFMANREPVKKSPYEGRGLRSLSA